MNWPTLYRGCTLFLGYASNAGSAIGRASFALAALVLVLPFAAAVAVALALTSPFRRS